VTIETPAPQVAATRPAPRFGHVAALDGIRGLAVAMVVVYHFAPGILPAGFIGVDVFFVLSGFLITSLALGEHRSTERVAVGAFYARRARRLLPAAVTTVVVTVAIAAVVQPESTRGATRGDGIASLLYGANWWSISQDDSYQAAFGTESPLNHFWSLAVEEQFYLLFPLALVGIVVLVRRGGGTTRRLALTILAIAAAGALASALLMAVLHDPTADPSRVYFGTDTRIQAPLLGVAGACAWWLWSDRLRQLARPLAIVAVALVAWLAVIAATTGFRDTWLYEFGFLAIAAAALLVVLAACSGRTPLTRTFELRWLCGLGLVSYSVYLWHWPVRVFVSEDTTAFSGPVLFGVRIALTALAAGISYVVIETPFRRSREAGRVAVLWIVGLAAGVLAVWMIARPVAAPATAFSTTEAPVVESASATPEGAAAPPLPPLRILWFGDSVAWTLGGGHLDYPAPVGYDSPYDVSRMVIWNKADYSCPLGRNEHRSFGIVRQKTGWCVERETEWPRLIDEFSPDVVSWSATMFDTFDYRVDDRWLTFGSPEWDAYYRSELEAARAVATSRGAVFVLLAQADPVANPDETDQESLLPENLWRYRHVRDLQRQFAEQHPEDTGFVDLQPIVCPEGSCADLTMSEPGMRSDGLHFLPGTVVPIADQIEDAFDAALGRER
jgi:peptidoglycan/LPS O-acetylase OafA/YrhL